MEAEIILPELHAPYSFAFEIDGENFYTWDDMSALPLSRKFTAGAMLDLRQLRIGDEQLDKTLAYMERLLDPSDGTVQAGDAMVLIHELRKRLQMLPLPKLVIRLAVELFFKIDDNFEEDLAPEEAARRIKLFEKVKKKVIFQKAMLDITGLHALLDSASSSQAFLRELEMTQVIADQQDRFFSGENHSQENL